MKKMFCLTLVAFTMACVNSAFAFAKYVDITTTYTGGDVTDFPVLVKITTTTPTGFYSDVKNAGADLKFTDANGNGDYPYEIDTWNVSGDSYIWVKLPKLSTGMTFRMYYGDEEQTAQTTKPTDVWTGYDLVCHVSGNANDSATPSRGGSLNPSGTTKDTGIVGKTHGVAVNNVGAAMINDLYYDGTTGELPDGQFSYSFWFRANGAFDSWLSLVGPRNGADVDAWGIRTQNPYTMLEVRTVKDNNYLKVSNCDYTIGAWHKIDVAMNDAAVSFYIDGVSVGSATLGGKSHRIWVKSMGWGGTCGSGTFETSNASCPVDVDECRIFSTVADAARVAADYQTVANVATFLSFSDPHGEVVVEVLPQGVIFK
mgnify:CR=1 FL=1